jgi:hypothetical protein
MKKNNLIRFVQSLAFFPLVMTGTVPLGDVIKNGVKEGIQTVFVQKENIEANAVLAFNQISEQKAESLKARAQAIDDYFQSRDMPLAGLGMKMTIEAEKNDLDWRLLPAIAVRESTGGKFDCQKVENNPFGWGSCKIGFNSNEEAIETVARNLGGNNPGTEKHYANKSLKQILRAYNPPSVVPRYAEQVMSMMKAIGPEEFPILNTPASSYVPSVQTG